ncbi:hypothetical protein MTR67_034316 [Solanum verrucosum]|uniref:Integrase zinc-binding domain-containing protein n=1 Tax=Solanum verrucosum TaxID=315347 RepID=A0AAF0U867_SOLVR|nr:hypothetical protein MTR67_034316 [Solanum verrucosum]
MEEAHSSRYSIHSGSTKMYRDLREVYWWNSMKKGIAEIVAKYLNCQQVKLEHQRPGSMAQIIELLEWKWEMINMDFITSLPRSRRQHDSIWVIVDRMIKSAHFLSKGLGLKVNLSTAFHLHTNGQAERTIQTVEDMLKACVIDFKESQPKEFHHQHSTTISQMAHSEFSSSMTRQRRHTTPAVSQQPSTSFSMSMTSSHNFSRARNPTPASSFASDNDSVWCRCCLLFVVVSARATAGGSPIEASVHRSSSLATAAGEERMEKGDRREEEEERRATSPLILTGDGRRRWVVASSEMADSVETRRKRKGWGAADLERRRMRNLGLGLLVD